jgi:hypothetical protein
VIEKQNVRARFEDISLYEFVPPTPMGAAALSAAREGCGDSLLAAVMGAPGVGGAVCRLHTHKSRVEEDTEINLTQVGWGGDGLRVAGRVCAGRCGMSSSRWSRRRRWGAWDHRQRAHDKRQGAGIAAQGFSLTPAGTRRRTTPLPHSCRQPQEDRVNSALDLFLSPNGININVDTTGRLRFTRTQRAQFDRIRSVR